MANHHILRITREITDIQKGSDLSLSVACRDSDVRHVKALIIGPPDTPYEFGFFEFWVKFGKEYPTKAPHVTAITTNGGQCRFNPNIYAQGKVCLSILGTWRGERGEEWSSAQGLESILISIQSLMSADPYENEPGYEHADSPPAMKEREGYVDKIRHETLRISVVERLEQLLGIQHTEPRTDQKAAVYPYNAEEEYQSTSDDPIFEPFKDLFKRRFLWYYDSYMSTIEKASQKINDDTPFMRMPFEGGGNSMEGKFNYSRLKRRLEIIRDQLDKETLAWAGLGQQAVQSESRIASNLQRQYEQVVEAFKKNDSVTIDIELVEKNPFVWHLVLFGRPMTNFDGGVFNIKVYFSPKFPEEQPRVTFETPLFHQRISSSGVLCYFPPRPEDVKAHIEAIVEAVEDEAPAYDPRTLVNPEAARLLWGNADAKKDYNRKLRRSVQRSSE
ncbi:MAG: hypothetical protein M1821_007142 [Bathelium mastoideum]|nr:MAG: hypothetical protein M1821_007142 [Bathelium mastoideum]KAI9694652.1 MAG: hypothetical protein M1822_000268 [Bathelium mastoideum]